MTKFDINRFGRTLGWSFNMARKEMVTQVATMTFAFFMPFLIHMLSSYKAHTMEAANSLISAIQVSVFIYFIITMIGGSWLFSNMKTKEQRVTFKMLPATDLEKFVVRALYVTVVWWAMAFVAFCLADLLRMLISLVAGIKVVMCAIPGFLELIFGSAEGKVSFNGVNELKYILPIIFSANAWFFWLHSLYILGGALFRRRQFVLTTLVHFIIGLAFTPLLINVIDDIDGKGVDQLFIAVTWTAGIVLVLVGLLDWWLSYKIFRRMQVINNKWLNL